MLDYDTSNLAANGGMGLAGDKQPYGINNSKHIDIDKVNSMTAADLGITVDGIKQYIFGIRIIDPDTGKEMPDEIWNTFVDQAISKVEHQLGIVIVPRVVAKEKHDYIENEFYTNNFIQTLYRPIIQVQEIEMVFNNQPMIKYPSSMWKVYHLAGQLKTYPADLLNGAGAINQSLNPVSLGLGSAPLWGQVGIVSSQDAPQISSVTYVAGVLPPARRNVSMPWEMPNDLKALIAKNVLKEAIEVWGETILKPGIASQGVSMDGMSEHIDATLSAENAGASARNRLIDKEIDQLLDSLRNYYGTTDIIGI